MSGKPEELIYKTTSKLNYDMTNEPTPKDKPDYYNLSIATFTFGGRQNQQLLDNNNMEANMMGTFKNLNTYKKTKELISPEDYTAPHTASSFINKIGQHNSFLSVVIHSLWHMKIFRNFILSEINLNLIDKDPRNRLLAYLKNVFSKYGQGNNKIDLSNLRVSLAENFQNRRKFIIDQPDDPVDCYYAFINALHSHCIVN
jgi:hypothetical protein